MKVRVCSSCYRASCWHGKFYCEGYKTAGTVDVHIDYLHKWNLEHSDHLLVDKREERAK